jgi:hypothetical protein
MFGGIGPTPESDLDLFVRTDPALVAGRSRPWIQNVMRSIATDFEAEAGFPLSLHYPDYPGMFLKQIRGTTPFRTLFSR